MSAKSPPTKTKPPAPAKPRTPPPTWDEQLINRLTPWRAELLGGALLLLVFFILLGLSGLPTLTGVDWLAGLLNQLAGWGTYILCFLLGLVGLQLILRRTRRRFRLRPSQVIGLELMTLAALALSYLLGRPTLAGAYQGRGGGIIGWALSSPLIEYLGPFLTALLYGGLLLWGFAILLGVRWLDVLRWLTQAADRLQQWAGHIQQPAGTTIPTSGSGPAQPAAVPPPRIRQPAAQPEATASPRPERRNPLLPPLTLLEEEKEALLSQTEIEQKKRIIEQTLKDFDLAATVTEIRRGPAVTQFGVQPGYVERPGPDGQPRQYKVRVGQIAALHRDLALALAAPRLRIEAPVPGRGIVGVEVPNGETSVVRLRSILNADAFRHIRGTLAVGMGRDVAGAPVATDLAKLPHLLIAGTTGSGKSVCINALVACLVCNNTPEQLRLVMMDPKKVELIRFNGLPHLLGRVEVEHERIIGVLRWLTAEMDRRYQAFAALGARHLQDYNRKIAGARQPATTPAPTPAPP
ncbi:MAG: DNA translocase FtsK 4TM domain-containing protein, partial [Chloroflexota bacterium]